MNMGETPPEGEAPQGEPQQPNLRARVPDYIGDGVFSTGAIVVTGPSEFVVDFIQNVGRPHRVASRVVMPHPVLPQFIDALRKNLALYSQRFGDPPQPPKPPTEGRRPSAQEIYDDLKMSDDVLTGSYANAVMIGHGASEFNLDFLTSFFPQSAVSARIYLAAGQIPRLIDSLENAVQQLRTRTQQAQAAADSGNPSDQPEPEPPAPEGPSPDPPSTHSPGDDLLPPSDGESDSQ